MDIPREDKKWFRRELARYDAVLMGSRTFAAIKRPLTPRNRIVFSRHLVFQCSTEHWNTKCETFGFSGSPHDLRGFLEKRRWIHIAVVGGTQIYDWFLKRNLIGEIYLTVEPIIFGKGRLFSAGFGKSLRVFRLTSMKKLNRKGTLLLHYKK